MAGSITPIHVVNMMIEVQDLALVEEVVDTQIVMVLIKR
jgi:hypothetical protein